MLRRKQGHIVNISSMGGRIGFPYTEVYSACKDGLIGFTRVLRTDYRKAGVSSSVLILGSIGGGGGGGRAEEGRHPPNYALDKNLLSPPQAIAPTGPQNNKREKVENDILSRHP